MNAREYFAGLQDAIRVAPHVLRSEVRFDEIDENECYVSGVLLLIGDLELHVAEYIVTVSDPLRLKYRYHLQTIEGALLSRWDNAPHHREVTTFPDHRHDDSGAANPAPPMDLPGVLSAALAFSFPAGSGEE